MRFAICLLACFTAPHVADAETPARVGLSKRVPLTTSRVVGAPEPPPPFRAKRVYPALTFKQPLEVVAEPGTERLLLVERYGRIVALPGDRDSKETQPFLDTKRETYSLCFHPRYERNGYVYVFSNLSPDQAGRKDVANDAKAKFNRISRYTASRGSPHRAEPDSELKIIEWRSNGHNGHYVRFGPDGMLWISAGDGTVGMDPELDGQDVSNLRGTMIRIDVDRPSEDSAYSVPKDNPFVNREDARPEIWAFGFRNPYRFAFNPDNDSLWVADIGQDAWEMIYRVRRGGNYGWSIMEGPAALNLTRPRGPAPITPPVVSHPHSEMRSITGGFFYRGRRFPELRGVYLYGDYDTRRLWGMRYDDKTDKVTFKQELARTKYRIISIDEDHDREIVVSGFGGELFTLERRPPGDKPPFPFPRRLSDSGLFASTAEHRPAPGVIPYSVNSPLWSDGAHKERFIAVPGTGGITYTASRAWGFPRETVLVKTFALDMQTGDPATRRRIETRFLTLGDNDEWVGYSYRWNDDQTDAVLVESGGRDETFRIQDASAPGGVREQTWRYPSRAECMVCHTREARYLLGLTTLQMNRNHDYSRHIADGRTANQIRTLAHIGLLTGPLPKTAIDVESDIDAESLPALPDPYDESQPLEQRARSWLHTNCWHCHVTNGGGNAQIELHYQKTRPQTKMFDVRPRHIDLGIPEARLIAPGDPDRSLILHRIKLRGKHQMPPVASNRVDRDAVELITEWIRGTR